MAITIEQELQECISQLNDAEKCSILQWIRTFVQGREKAERVSIAQYNKEIDEALGEIERGETYSHEEVVKLSKDW